MMLMCLLGKCHVLLMVAMVHHSPQSQRGWLTEEELGCEIDFADVGHHQDDRLAYSPTKLFALAFYFFHARLRSFLHRQLGYPKILPKRKCLLYSDDFSVKITQCILTTVGVELGTSLERKSTRIFMTRITDVKWSEERVFRRPSKKITLLPPL